MRPAGQGRCKRKKSRGEKSRAEARPLQLPAGGAFGLGPFWFGVMAGFTGGGGADFVGRGVAGALEGAPHVPTGDGAVGAPAFAEGEELLRLGQVLCPGGYVPALFYAR